MTNSPFVSVAEDLEFLRTWGDGNLWNPGPPDDVLRRGSVTLRLLLVDQLLQRAWRHHGFAGQPWVAATVIDVPAALARLAPRHVVHASAHFVIEEGPGTVMREGDDRFVIPVNRQQLRLQDYTEGAALLVDRHVVRRREIIKYFANRLGGAHLALGSRTRKKEDELMERIAEVDGYAVIRDREALRFELRETGIALATAPDLVRLEQAIRACK